MLFSQFIINNDRYVIPAKNVNEIVPFVSLKSIPEMPEYVAGLLNYHGSPIPVIDICRLFLGRPSKKILSTRIIVVSVNENSTKLVTLGLLVEKATEMVSIKENSFEYPGIKNPDAIIDGPIAIENEELVTRVIIGEIFEKVDKRLFLSAISEVDGG